MVPAPSTIILLIAIVVFLQFYNLENNRLSLPTGGDGKKQRERKAYLFLKCFSFLFSRKACMPSFWSSVPKQVAKARAS